MKRAAFLVRPLITAAGLIAVWWGFVWLTRIPAYMMPDPPSVAVALWTQRRLLFDGTLTTLGEILLGLGAGTLLGTALALVMMFSRSVRRWLLPVILLSQTIPVFALAPLLVLWFGFGIASKVVMATLIIFFPITAAFFDGLNRTEPGWLELARTMNASPWTMLRYVRLPAALPAFGSGLRIAAIFAPIGAIIGEWVGASSGLGYVMLNANARIQTDVMFAALLVLSVTAIALWFAVDQLVKRLIYWVPRDIDPP